MALIPRAFRPALLIRRKALFSGLLGRSTFWKVIGIYVFGKGTLKKLFGKNPEVISREKIGYNAFVNVINAKPMPTAERKAKGITKERLRAQASTDVADAWARKAADTPKRKVRRRAEKTARMAAEARAKADKRAS